MKIAVIICIVFLSGLCFGQKNNAESSAQKTSSIELVFKLKKLQKQKELAEQRRAALLTEFTEEYHAVQSINSKISALGDQIASISKELESSAASRKEAVDLIVLVTSLRKRLQLCDSINTDEECTNGKIKRKLAETYQKMVKNPEVLDLFFANAFEMPDFTFIKAPSAPPKSPIADEQNAELLRMINSQNQRIIELLERVINDK